MDKDTSFSRAPPLDDKRKTRLSALRAALAEGEESGRSTPFDFEAFIAAKRESARR